MSGFYPDPTVPGLATLQTQITAIDGHVSTLQADVAAVNDAIAIINTTISGMETAITAVESDVATNTTDIAANAAGIATNTTDIATLNTAIAPLARLQTGEGTLDGLGNYVVPLTTGVSAVVACWLVAAGAGQVITQFDGSNWNVFSSVGMADSGQDIVWIAF